MLPNAWVELIDKLFATSEHANRSKKNKANRAKQPYGSYHGSQSLVNRRYKEVKETGHAQHVKGWEEMHFKKGKWCNEKASQDWEKIENKYNESLLRSDGNKTLVNEVECLKEALGSRRSHIRGIGRTLKSVTPNSFSNVIRHEEDERWQRQEKAMEELRLQNAFLQQQMNYILKVTNTQLPSSSRQLDEDEDEDDDDNDDEDGYRPTFD